MKRILLIAVFLLYFTGQVWGVCGDGDSHCYVDADALGSGSGDSWPNAFTTLQQAVTASSPGDTIWIDGDLFLLNDAVKPDTGAPGQVTTFRGDPDNNQNPTPAERPCNTTGDCTYPVFFGGAQFSVDSWTEQGSDGVYYSPTIPPACCRGVFEQEGHLNYTNYREVSTYANCVAVAGSYWVDKLDTKGHGNNTIFVHTPGGTDPNVLDNIYYSNLRQLVTFGDGAVADDYLTFQDIYFVGGLFGVEWQNASTDVTFEGCTFTCQYKMAINLAGNYANDNIVVNNCIIHDLTSATAIRTAPATLDLTVTRTIIHDISSGKNGETWTGKGGIFYTGAGTFIARRNKIYNMYGVGDTDADRLLTSGTHSKTDGGRGFWLSPEDTATVVIDNNEIHDCVGWGIWVDDDADWTDISNNYIYNIKRSGIYFLNGGEGIIQGNIVDTVYAGQGIVVRGSTYDLDVVNPPHTATQTVTIANNFITNIISDLGRGIATYMVRPGENGNFQIYSNTVQNVAKVAFYITQIGDGYNGAPYRKVYLHDNSGYVNEAGAVVIDVHGTDDDLGQDYAISTLLNVELDDNNWYIDGNANVLGQWDGTDYGTLALWQAASGQDANSTSTKPPLFDPQDIDGDGVLYNQDNCTLIANSNQRDSNGDGYGNRCDGDVNNDGIVNSGDLALFRQVFFTSDADCDLDGDGIVNSGDLGLLRGLFFKPPGPTGLAP